jgi:hypothetical protein
MGQRSARFVVWAVSWEQGLYVTTALKVFATGGGDKVLKELEMAVAEGMVVGVAEV